VARRRHTAIGCLLVLGLVVPGVGAALGPDDIAGKDVAQCDELRRAHPRELAAYLCLLQAGQRGEWDAARRRLDEILTAEPGNPRAQLYRGLLAVELREPRAEDLLRAATGGFEAEGERRGETWARISVAWNIYYQGRRAEARAELDLALEVARASREADLVGEVEVSIGWYLNHDAEHGEAWTVLKRAEQKLVPDGPLHARVRLLGGLAAAAWGLDLLEDALEYSQRHLELVGPRQPAIEAGVRTNLALIARGLVRIGLMSEEELVRLKREALDAAIRSGNRHAEARAHLLLGESLENEEGLAQARRGLAIAREIDDRSALVWALWSTAEHQARAGADRIDEALRLVDEGEEISRRFGDPEGQARARLVRSVIEWNRDDRARGVDEALAALDDVERIRDRQPDREARARVFSRFAHAYRRAAGFLLDGPGPYDPEAVERAFQVMERLRARSLLDTLDAVQVTERLLPDDPRGTERGRLLVDIAEIQTRLIALGPDETERARLLGRLEALEVNELALRQELARSHPRFGAVRGPVPPSVAEVQAELGPDQAIVSFQMGVRGTSGARAVVLTHDRATAVALSDLGSLEQEVRTYLSLLERRDGTAEQGAVRLHAILLADALRTLPDGVRRLLVVPDGPLHRLPFSSLRVGAGGPCLAELFEISVVPSHAAWLRFRRAPESTPPRSLLALADPAAPLERVESTGRTSGTLRGVASLGRLPHAVSEVRRVRSALGGESVVLTGERANEAAVKGLDLGQFRVLHFAAHALVDERNPDRSAVLLAAGAPAEDGLLQYREVADLDLRGPVVVLSACRSGSGPVVGGDGVLGLAQAFFLAGSRTVVASLWPLRDDEAAALVGRFAQALGQGGTVTAALTEAQRAMIDRGAPSAAWAGLVVLGDGDRALFRGNGFGWGWSALLGLVAAGLALAAIRVLAARSARFTNV